MSKLNWLLRALVLVVLILLLCSVAVADHGGTTAPNVVSGPFALDRPMSQALPIGFEGWTPATTQVIPEGCMGSGYKTYLVIYNSGDKRARVSVVASGERYYFTTSPFLVNAHQRRTYEPERSFADYMLKGYWTNPDVSFQVLSDTPGVYAQVSMYWDGGGHTSTGFFK